MLSVSTRVPAGDDLPTESCLSITAGFPAATGLLIGADFRAFERVPVAIYIYGSGFSDLPPSLSATCFIPPRRGNRDIGNLRARSFQSRHVDIGYARIFDNRTR